MAGLKTWDGSAFVDGQPRIWNGSAFVTPSACHVWDGTQFVKVWPTFSRQRMTKSGTWIMSMNARVTGWVPDVTSPATIVSDQLVVDSGGSATIDVSWTIASIGYGYRMNLRRNAVTIAYQDRAFNQNGTFTFSASSVTLAHGDTLDLWVSNQTGGGGSPQLTAGHIDVTPT